MKERDVKRFHLKYRISKSGCWEWIGRLNKHGYGVFVIGHAKAFLAHRVIFEHLFGELKSGICVLHSCDNRKCVNPAHLYSGTQQDNIMDMIKKGRAVYPNPKKGESNPMAKLSQKQIIEIRNSYFPRKVTLKSLSEKFKVSQTAIWKIVKNKGWIDE